MDRLPPEHPPIKTEKADAIRHSRAKDAGRWLGAAALVLVVHGAGAYGLHTMSSATVAAGQETETAIVVEFAPELVAPPPAEQIADSVQPETTTEPIDEITPEVPEPVVEPQPEPAPAEEPIPDIVDAEKPEVVVPKPVEPIVQPEPKPEPVVEHKPKPKPEPVKPAKPKPVKEKKPVPDKKLPSKNAQKATESRQAVAPLMNGAEGSVAAAPKLGAFNEDIGRASQKWQAKLQSHMARHTKYLKRTMDRSTKGNVKISMLIDASGNVLSARLYAPSGNSTVDKLGVEAANRASPVPAPPPATAKAKQQVIVELSFQ